MISYEEALNKFMYDKGHTTESLSEATGLSKSLISKLRQGIRVPTITAALALSKAGVPMPKWSWKVNSAKAELVAEVG